MAIQTLTLNVNAQPSAEDRAFLYLSQNENGRDIRFRVLGDDLPSGCTATLSGVKPDGNVWSKAGTVTNNFVVVEEDIQMTAVAGRWDAQLDIVNGSKNIVTALIRITVEAAAVEAGAVPSDTQLEGYVEQCKQYAESAKNEAYGSPLTAATAAAMTDQSRVYVYTGSETGYTAGHWYYHNGTSWTDGGVYNAVAVDTDTTLSVSGKAADAKKTGDEISQIKEDLNAVFITDSASGSTARFVDGADGVPMKSVKVNITPVQSGSGDPSPDNVRPISGWDSVKVTRAGKNLLPKYVINPPLYNGVTFTVNSDGSVRANGTASATCNASSADITGIDGEVVLSGCPSDGSATTYQIWIYDKTANASTTIVDTGNGSTGTLIKDHVYSVRIRIQSRYTIDKTFYPMLRLSSDSDTYEPYNGDTYTVSLSSAGTVYGGMLDAVSGELVVDRAQIASYNGEVLPSTWISDRDVYASGTTPTIGAQVVYTLATPLTYQLSATEIKSLLGINNVWSDAGGVEVEYRADTRLYIEKLTQPEEDDMIADSAITSGQFFMIGNSLYRALTNIASGATITVGTNAQRVSLSDALNLINT